MDTKANDFTSIKIRQARVLINKQSPKHHQTNDRLNDSKSIFFSYDSSGIGIFFELTL